MLRPPHVAEEDKWLCNRCGNEHMLFSDCPLQYDKVGPSPFKGMKNAAGNMVCYQCGKDHPSRLCDSPKLPSGIAQGTVGYTFHGTDGIMYRRPTQRGAHARRRAPPPPPSPADEEEEEEEERTDSAASTQRHGNLARFQGPRSTSSRSTSRRVGYDSLALQETTETGSVLDDDLED